MSEVEAINQLLAAHVEAVNSSNVEANLAGFTDDQIYMPTDSMPIRGKPDLSILLRQFYDEHKVQIEMEAEETVVAGTWAYQWGFIKGEMRSLETNEVTAMDWKFMYIWKQQGDGAWKVHRDIYNNNVPSRT